MPIENISKESLRDWLCMDDVYDKSGRVIFTKAQTYTSCMINGTEYLLDDERNIVPLYHPDVCEILQSVEVCDRADGQYIKHDREALRPIPGHWQVKVQNRVGYVFYGRADSKAMVWDADSLERIIAYRILSTSCQPVGYISNPYSVGKPTLSERIDQAVQRANDCLLDMKPNDAPAIKPVDPPDQPEAETENVIVSDHAAALMHTGSPNASLLGAGQFFQGGRYIV